MLFELTEIEQWPGKLVRLTFKTETEREGARVDLVAYVTPERAKGFAYGAILDLHDEELDKFIDLEKWPVAGTEAK